MSRESVALPADLHDDLVEHLVRADGQEDVCLAAYATSTGARRTSRLIGRVALPGPGDREVHGNASFTGGYILRVAAEAASRGEGIVMLHSHPRGRGWQRLSREDHEAELAFSTLALEVTGLPLVGMTLAGDGNSWSARTWLTKEPSWAESVRIVGEKLTVDWNDDVRPAPRPSKTHARTIAAWGPVTQASLARMRVLVVGVGSVGLDVAQRLAASGIQDLSVMDYDVVKPINLDRMIGATRRDARRARPKVGVAARLMRAASTAASPTIDVFNASICSPEGLAAALDFDIIFSCVDRPWPRAVLNTLAYADLIPVIDGGINIETHPGPEGGMRGASWRSHTLVPGRACLQCSKQIAAQEVTLDMGGLLDDPEYIRNAGRATAGSPNVALLSASVSAAQLTQLVSLVAQPAGFGVPRPLRYSLAGHFLDHLDNEPAEYCPVEKSVALGDQRQDLTRDEGPWTTGTKREPRALARLGSAVGRWGWA